jgi:alpha-tubulin suppressor-like RCC1 family protein
MAFSRLMGVGNTPLQSSYNLALSGSGVTVTGVRNIDAIQGPLIYQAGSVLGVGGNTNGDTGCRVNTTPLKEFASSSHFAFDIVDIKGTGSTWYYMDANGSVWSSGGSGNGQIGTGVFATQYVPQYSFPKAQTVAGGLQHAVLIDGDGYLWACGYNYRGRTGLGFDASTSTGTWTKCDTTNSGTTKFVKVSCGSFMTIAIDQAGIAWGFGEGTNGTFGQNDQTHRLLPTQLGTKSWNQISCGYAHTLGVDTDNKLWAWGYNNAYQCGTGNTTNVLAWTEISLGVTVQAVDAGSSSSTSHSVALDVNGEIWVAGGNQYGKTGQNTQTGQTTNWTKLNTGSTRFTKIRAGANETYALDTTGKLWVCGYNGAYQLDMQNTTNVVVLTQSNNPYTFTDLSSPNGSGIIAGLRSGRGWWSVGSFNGADGRGSAGAHYRYFSPITHIKADQGHNSPQSTAFMLLDDEGGVLGWGNNSQFQLGHPDTSGGYLPKTTTYTKYKWSTTGQQHAFLIDMNDKLFTAGSNTSGKTGLNLTSGTTSTWTQIGTDSWKMVSASSQQHSAAIRADDTLWAWGLNSSYQLGDGTNVQKNVPTQIGTDTWLQVVAGSNNTIGIRLTDGALLAWGANSSYVTGKNTASGSTTSPSVIASGTAFVKCSISMTHGLAIDTSGNLWAWGQNTNGECGTGTTAIVGVPTLIDSVLNWKNVSAGSNYSVAITEDDEVYVAGNGANYSFGVPIAVINFTKLTGNKMSILSTHGTTMLLKSI